MFVSPEIFHPYIYRVIFSYASSSTLYPCQSVSQSAEFRTSVARGLRACLETPCICLSNLKIIVNLPHSNWTLIAINTSTTLLCHCQSFSSGFSHFHPLNPYAIFVTGPRVIPVEKICHVEKGEFPKIYFWP